MEQTRGLFEDQRFEDQQSWALKKRARRLRVCTCSPPLGLLRERPGGESPYSDDFARCGHRIVAFYDGWPCCWGNKGLAAA